MQEQKEAITMEALSYYMNDAALSSDADHVSRAVDGRSGPDEAASSLSFASLLENFICQSLAESPAVSYSEDACDSAPSNVLF